MGLNVYLADLPKAVTIPSPVRYTMQHYFDTIAKQHGKVGKVKVQWTSTRPLLSKHDLLVYFVNDRDDTVVKTGLGSTKPIDADADGYTLRRLSDRMTGSEVYLGDWIERPEMLGKLAFHELMHNVAQMDDNLHNQPGLSLGAETIEDKADLSQGDIDLMVKHLTKTKRLQWAEGFSHYHDPFRAGP